MKARPLTSRELGMIGALLGVAFAFGNLFLLQGAIHRYQKNDAEIRRLRNDLVLSRAWIEDKDLWAERAAWLSQKQPKVGASGLSSVALLESLQKFADDDGLNIDEQTLKEPRQDPGYQEVSVQLRLSGSLESLARWMTQVQQPESFQAAPSFSLQSNENAPSLIRCSLTVTRWYALPTQ